MLGVSLQTYCGANQVAGSTWLPACSGDALTTSILDKQTKLALWNKTSTNSSAERQSDPVGAHYTQFYCTKTNHQTTTLRTETQQALSVLSPASNVSCISGRHFYQHHPYQQDQGEPLNNQDFRGSDIAPLYLPSSNFPGVFNSSNYF